MGSLMSVVAVRYFSRRLPLVNLSPPFPESPRSVDLMSVISSFRAPRHIDYIQGMFFIADIKVCTTYGALNPAIILLEITTTLDSLSSVV